MGKRDVHYRQDGVRVTHDCDAPGMREKYGGRGECDPEGFDPYADTVGPGIYGGNVQRDAEGRVVVGRQYQNHNPTPGPVYAGTGYTEMAEAIHSGDPNAVLDLLRRKPHLLEDVSTGGARPLHICGMSRQGQRATSVLVAMGADVNALDTYGYTPLFRMASNNLADGAQVLLRGGADLQFVSSSGESAASIARQSHAWDVLTVLRSERKRIEHRHQNGRDF